MAGAPYGGAKGALRGRAQHPARAELLFTRCVLHAKRNVLTISYFLRENTQLRFRSSRDRTTSPFNWLKAVATKDESVVQNSHNCWVRASQVETVWRLCSRWSCECKWRPRSVRDITSESSVPAIFAFRLLGRLFAARRWRLFFFVIKKVIGLAVVVEVVVLINQPRIDVASYDRV